MAFGPARRAGRSGPTGSTALLATLVVAGLLAGSARAQETRGTGAVVGGTLVDGTGAPPVTDAAVVFRDGRITCAGPRSRCPVPADVPVVDAGDRWIIPGLVDGHVHYSQTGWADGRPDQAADLRERGWRYDVAMAENRAHPERWHRAYLCSGVTAVWDVGGYPWTWDLRERAEADPRAPHVVAAGPLLSTRDHWLNLPGERQFLHLSDAEAAEGAAEYLVASGTDQIKVWYLVGEDDPAAAHHQRMLRIAAEVAEEAGVPLIVHATGLWQAKDALRAGADHLVHSVYDQEVDEEFVELARAAGASYNPTLTVFRGVREFAERRFDGADLDLACVDPTTLAKARETEGVPGGVSPERTRQLREAGDARYRLMLRNLRTVHEAGIPVVMGTDAGNTLTLHGPSVFAEMEAMQEAGLSPMEVLLASTRNAARAMGRGEELGTVEPGRVADLVLLAADPTEDVSAVRTRTAVIRAGWLHTVASLRYR